MYSEKPRRKPVKKRVREAPVLRRPPAHVAVRRVGAMEAVPRKRRPSVRRTPGGKIISILVSPFVAVLKPFVNLFKKKPKKPGREIARVRRPAYKISEEPSHANRTI